MRFFGISLLQPYLWLFSFFNLLTVSVLLQQVHWNLWWSLAVAGLCLVAGLVVLTYQERRLRRLTQSDHRFVVTINDVQAGELTAKDYYGMHLAAHTNPALYFKRAASLVEYVARLFYRVIILIPGVGLAMLVLGLYTQDVPDGSVWQFLAGLTFSELKAFTNTVFHVSLLIRLAVIPLELIFSGTFPAWAVWNNDFTADVLKQIRQKLRIAMKGAIEVQQVVTLTFR